MQDHVRRTWDALGREVKELDCGKNSNAQNDAHRSLVARHFRALPMHNDRLFEMFRTSQEALNSP